MGVWFDALDASRCVLSGEGFDSRSLNIGLLIAEFRLRIERSSGPVVVDKSSGVLVVRCLQGRAMPIFLTGMFPVGSQRLTGFPLQ